MMKAIRADWIRQSTDSSHHLFMTDGESGQRYGPSIHEVQSHPQARVFAMDLAARQSLSAR